MNHLLSFVLPLTSAILYVFGALCIKRAGELGAGVWLISFVANLACAVLFSLLLIMGGTFHAELLWQPALAAVLFFAGQVACFFSIDRGDVSVATPVLGLKIILVAIFSALLMRSQISIPLWIAAVLAVIGVTLLSRSTGTGAAKKPGALGFTLITSFLAALAFALFDVLVMMWSPGWGVGVFLPVMLGFVALFSLSFIPLFKGTAAQTPKGAWRWLLGGSVLYGLQSVIFVTALAVTGLGTAVNVVYSTRGLWSVVVVWMLGHWFHNLESRSGGSMALRLGSAALIAVAVVLAVVGK